MQQMPCIAVFLNIHFFLSVPSLAGIPANLIIFDWRIL
jgi:hypothetical protein